LQRWFADPVVDRDGIDRGLGIIFTHDHYGPSTHQQIGLYSTLLAEPAESTWVHNETGVPLGTRQAGCGDPNLGCDGGPTSWQAAIIPSGWSAAQGQQPFREFYFEFSDFQHAYEAGVYVGAGPDGRPFNQDLGEEECNEANDPDCHENGINTAFPVTDSTFRHAINPSVRQQAVGNNGNGAPEHFPDILRFPAVCDKEGTVRPCPEAISADDPGMLVVNYRNEPVGLRVFDPYNPLCPDDVTDDLNADTGGCQAAGLPGDLAFALESRIDRAIPQMNVQPTAATSLQVGQGGFYVSKNEAPGAHITPTLFTPPLNSPKALEPGDPYTPMLRVQQGDIVKIKIQAGAHEHEHNATLHGVKWVQGNSGHGPNRPAGGWRAAQNAGISEQFNFSMPVSTDPAGEPQEDYAYSIDASQDGWWSGTWGIIRSYETAPPDLYQIGPEGLQVNNGDAFIGACPDFVDNDTQSGESDGIPDNLRSYSVVAITANELLGNVLLDSASNPVQIIPGDSSATMHVGGPLDPEGGTLVYNPRPTDIPAAANVDVPDQTFPRVSGPLHDPTALLYVRLEDLEPIDAGLRACEDQPARGNRPFKPGVARVGCPVRLKAGAPVEPVILRANAGDCIQVTLFNRLPETAPDLAGYNTLLPMIIRDRQAAFQAGEPANSVTTFNNNLIRPSSYVGLHPQMVEYDVNKGDGTVVGLNPADQIAPPDSQVTYTWYAGHLSKVEAECVGRGRGGRDPNPNQRCVDLVPTPVEFGGSNLTPADVIKQGQKGLIGAFIVEPVGSVWHDSLGALEQVPNRQDGGYTTVGTRADMTIESAFEITPPFIFEDMVAVIQKGQNHRFADGTAVPNIASEGRGIPEDSHDSGQKGINYGTEPAWFRFGVAAEANFGSGLGLVDGEKMFSNTLTGGDPWTAVFTAPPGREARIRLLMPTGVGRGTTFDLHGHVWARDPYLPENRDCLTATSGLGDGITPLAFGGTGCGLSSVSIGHNPLAWYLGGQESVTPYAHFDVVLPSAGGVNSVTGDYLFRDHASFGVTDGIWGILRVELE
ncbi:MAG: hypothetical protein GTO00_04180, partial [Deltaproteobacteria bacterium]|nr:hypothetical protein [Deltaproteobacteria bacterium]